MSIFEPIFDALNAVQSRYVVVGGLAVVMRGHARLTADVDLICDLTRDEALKTMNALTSIGLRPRPPVTASDFADQVKRRSWIEDKSLRVFSLWDPGNPLREVDVFVESPIDFADLWSRSEVMMVRQTGIRVASIRDLITLKRLAGRPQDIQDIEALEAIEAGEESNSHD